MSLKITGLDEMQRKLKLLQRNAESLQGTHEVPFTELFPDAFVSRNTDYPNLQAMIDASTLGEAADFDGEEWNAFVVAHSQFPSWDEMKSEAGSEWAARKLGF